MTLNQRRARIAHELRMIAAQEIQIKDGIALMRRQYLEFQRNMAASDRWGLVAVISRAVLIPLHIVMNSLPLAGSERIIQDFLQRIVLAVQLGCGQSTQVCITLILKQLRLAAAKDLEERGMAEYVPGVGILIGLAQDSTAFLLTSIRISEGSTELSDEDRMLAKMIARTIQRATVALQELERKEIQLRRLA